jgi:hypothetical protein
MSSGKAHMTETLLVTRTTALDASEGFTTSADLVAMLKAPKASPTSATTKGEKTSETFLRKQRQWLEAREAAPVHLHPVFLVFESGSCSREAVTRLC